MSMHKESTSIWISIDKESVRIWMSNDEWIYPG